VHATATSLPGVIVIKPAVHGDDRGFFLESFHARKYDELGIPGPFVQDNHSRSKKGTLRGLHLQRTKLQGKLLRVIHGHILDVAVDVRRGSPDFGKWVSVHLSSDNFLQCWVPPGFAHGFVVLSETAEVEYKCTAFYDKDDEIGIAWNDPALNIDWEITDAPLLSPRDQNHPPLGALLDLLPPYSTEL
jgi:dTDP-4-dehydrorhamnose 3,5-epimerase